MRFDFLPRKKPVPPENPEEDDDDFTDPFFKDPQRRTAIEHLRALATENRRAAMAFTAASLVASACATELFRTQPKETEPSDTRKHLTLVNQIEISEERNDMVIVLGGEHSIRISDWKYRDQWDTDLVPETGNPTFAWHRQVLEKQYADSFTAEGKDMSGDPFEGKDMGGDPFYMPADIYPSFAANYGNMEIGDTQFVTNKFIELWLEAANYELGKNFDDQSDLSDLTAAEWMYVLQAPAMQITYDERLASIFPSYDEELASWHWKKNIRELLRFGTGVCRDNERLTVTSYMIANELFDLADNGLLYLPMVNIVDAKHTRGAFYLSINPVDMVVIGSDTTYGDGDIAKSFTAASQKDVAIWHSQQYDKDLSIAPKDQLIGFELFREYSAATHAKISPTTEAILSRQELQARIKLVGSSTNQRERKELVTKIYQDIFTQVSRDALVAPFPLNSPSRLVGLYDLLIKFAKEYDTLYETDGTNEVTAKIQFERYLADNGVDPEKARSLIHTIDRLPANERVERLQKIQKILDAHTSSREAQ